MSADEVNAIFSLLDINKDGKLNYAEVSLFTYQVTYILISCYHVAINRSALTLKPLIDGLGCLYMTAYVHTVLLD